MVIPSTVSVVAMVSAAIIAAVAVSTTMIATTISVVAMVAAAIIAAAVGVRGVSAAIVAGAALCKPR